MIGQHITLEGENVTVESVIIPEYVVEYHDEDWPMSDVAFWHWMYFHFDQE